MDLHLTSKLCFLSSSGEPITAPLEWQPALLEIKVPVEERKQVQLWRQSNRLSTFLQELNGKERILANWERSNPGYYQLKLEYKGEIEDYTITVWPEKINRESFAQMLEDLDTRLPTSVAIALQRTGALAGLKLPQFSETTLAQELVRLRRAVKGTENRPGLVEILPKIASDVHQILKNNEIWVRQEQARRPSANGLVKAFCRGYNLDTTGKPITLPDIRVEHTVDVYENRLVKLFVELVNQRLRRVKYIVDADKKETLLNEVESFIKQLKKAKQQAAFLNEVSQPKSLPNQITMVLLKRPAYHAALQGYLEYIRSPTVQLEESDLDAPLEKLYRLYQVWGTLWLIVSLLEVAEKRGYQVEKQRLVAIDKSGIYVKVLPNGKPAIILVHPQHKTTVKLIPERTYGKDGELHSASVTLRPDIAIEIKLPDGSHQVYIFDPKYKLDSEKQENISRETKPETADIQKMHTYHDAIYDNNNKQVVCYAAILYPGTYMTYSNREIEALPAYPGKETELKEHLYRILNKALNVC
ncbi:MAG: DUF2357 domain-containing protein [Phormidium sp.]